MSKQVDAHRSITAMLQLSISCLLLACPSDMMSDTMKNYKMTTANSISCADGNQRIVINSMFLRHILI